MGFTQYNLGQHLPNFMHLRQMVLKKNISIFSEYFFGLNSGHLAEAPFWSLGPLFEYSRLSTLRQCYIPNFKQLSLKKKIFKLFFLHIQDP